MSFALSLAQVVFANLFDFPGAALALPPSQVADSSASASSHLHLPGLGSSSSPSSGAASNSKRPRHPSGVLRRQFIARCRELRADVRRFEESFESKHGRTPTSTSDRAPLAATYFEYKRLKVHVRGDAALHIQALWRGSTVRRQLRAQGKLPLKSSPLSGGSAAKKRAGGVDAAPLVAHVSAEGGGQRGSAQTLDRNGGTTLPAAPVATSHSSSSSSSFPSSSASSTLSASAAAAATLQLAALRTEKSSLKALLRDFDSRFAAGSGRNPSRADKEHLRPQYLRYHVLKTTIADLEASLGIVSAGETASAEMAGAGAGGAPPGGGALSGVAEFGSNRASGGTTSDLDIDGDHEGKEDGGGGARATSSAAAASGKLAPPDASGTLRAGAPTDSSGHGGGGGAADSIVFHNRVVTREIAMGDPALLRDLKAEKRRLQIELRNFERDFEEREKRKVKFLKDIASVAEEYARYKALKIIIKEGAAVDDDPH